MEDYKSKSELSSESPDKPGQFELFTKVIKAGKKTYFFDIRKSKIGDHYLVITESTKKSDDDGKTFYNRHKIFVSREDLLNFREGLDNAIGHFDSLEPSPEFAAKAEMRKAIAHEVESGHDYTSIDFDDLGRVQSKEK
jgi:hypothetical protein